MEDSRSGRHLSYHGSLLLPGVIRSREPHEGARHEVDVTVGKDDVAALVAVGTLRRIESEPALVVPQTRTRMTAPEKVLQILAECRRPVVAIVERQFVFLDDHELSRRIDHRRHPRSRRPKIAREPAIKRITELVPARSLPGLFAARSTTD